jgi:hypothetical protein
VIPLEGHAPTPVPSSWHWNVTPACESEYVKCAEVWFVGFAGCEVIAGVGGVVLIVHVYEAAELVFVPEIACTLNVCDPSASGPAYVIPLGEQAVNPAPSSWHWNVTPACESVYVKCADVWFVGLVGCEVIVGAVTAGPAASAIPTAVRTAASAVTTTARLTPLAIFVSRYHRI